METLFSGMKGNLRTLFVAVLLLLGNISFAQGWRWSRGMDAGKAHLTSSSGYAWPVATDASGNVYVAMWSSFDSLVIGASSYHSNPFKSQAVLIKYDNNGNVLWTRGTSNGSSAPVDIAVDGDNNIYFLGVFSGDSIRFSNSLLTRSSASAINSCYLIKLDSDGNILWKTNSGSIDLGYEKQSYGGLAVDDQGNAWVAATFSGNSLIGTYSLNSSGGQDISVAKYGPAGGLLWAKRFGATGYERVSGISIAKDGSAFLVGEFSSSTLVLGATVLTYAAAYTALSDHCFNVFVSRIGSNGSVSWARQTTGHTRAMCVTTDTAGGVYFGGNLRAGSVNLGGGNITGNENNPYFAHYNSDGSFIRSQVFTQSVSTESPDFAIWGMTVDPCNNVWVSGGMDTLFGNGVYLDTAIVLPMPQAGIDPLFIACYSDDGTLRESVTLRSGGKSNSGLASDPYGNIFLCGYYDGSETFWVGSDSLATAMNVFTSFFAAKYAPANGCFVTGLTSVSESRPLGVYPNPADNAVNFVAVQDGSYTVSDIMGRQLLSGHVAAGQATIDVSRLLPGIYVMRMDGQEPVRFVKR